ncbi:4-O-methyl-glucuronoyl methylesterase [Paramyrothecium foliicola]|nr:4-O-methyl-glucuronoyl methylesterase [Paramyrothecium foliicola]
MRDFAHQLADLVLIPRIPRISTQEEWRACQRPQLLAMLQEYQYGYYPDHSQEKVSATRNGNSISISVTAGGKTGKFSATLALPSGKGPFPVVINIGGMDNGPYLQKGISIVGFNYNEVAPDGNSKTGAFWSLYNGRDIGVLTAWAWGFHRVIDALDLVVPEINTSKVGATGCSRLGKGALAAGLFSERITLSMPMSSGVQGAGPYRYYTLSGQGENLDNSKQGAPWWSSQRLAEFIGHHTNLPYDAHTIVAAIAPRAVIMDQGTGDAFVNSKGTSVVVFPAAREVYKWLGADNQIALAVRNGGHCDMSGYTNVLPYVEHILKGVPLTRDYHNYGSYGSAMKESYPWGSQNLPA